MASAGACELAFEHLHEMGWTHDYLDECGSMMARDDGATISEYFT
jgi:hypothetical protein